ncbi:hypothetical protein OH77DRAFT_1424489 [Trametes cingulata]|nr:hypothetical protein OH77DRAFT_1424489 [Trametes cingulata]
MAEASSTPSNPLANFQFTAIGQPPALLKRLSAPEEVSGLEFAPSPSPSPLSSPKAPTSNIPQSSSSRRSLLSSLAGIEDLNMTAESTPVQVAANEASQASGSSGASARVAPGSEPSLPSVKNTRTSPAMNGSNNTSRSPPSQARQQAVSPSGSATTRPALGALLPVPSLSFSAAAGLSPALAGRPSLQQDDAIDAFRHALQRLHAESEEYSRREEETRHAMARQQDQAARWHARADALLESFSGLFAQCERKVASANHAVAEVERLQSLVRQKESEVDETRRKVVSLEAEKAELGRALEELRLRGIERLRLMEANAAELRRAAEAAASQKAEVEAALRDLNAAIETAKRESLTHAAKREEEFLARLEEQKRAAEQEKQELLRQLQEQKKLTEQEKQKRMAGLVADQLRLEEQLRAEMEEHRRARPPNNAGAQDTPTDNRLAEGRPLGPSTGSVAVAPPPLASPSASGPSVPAVSTSATLPQPQLSPSSVFAAENGHATSQGRVALQGTHRSPSSSQDQKPLPILDVERRLPPDMAPVDPSIVKLEVVTPSLKAQQDQPSHHAATRSLETPTAKRVKPEPSTLGRKPSSASSSTSPRTAEPPVMGQLKPDAFTPLIERIVQPHPDMSNDRELPRREQSLDYEPDPSHSAETHANAPLSGGVMLSTAVPPATRTSGPPSRPPLQERISSGHTPANARTNASASGTPSPAEFLQPHSSLPDLEYPSREDTPALMMSTLPSDDRPMGLGIIDRDDRGAPLNSGAGSRGPTPPPAQPPAKRGRAQRRPPRVDHYSPVVKPAAPTWEPDHWSPSPGRELPRREAYSPPVRHKRTREDDSPERSISRRARVSPTDGESSRFAAPLPCQPSNRYEPGLPSYNERNRSRSRSPRLPPSRERSRSPPRNGYAPVPPHREYDTYPVYYPPLQPPRPPHYEPPFNYGASSNGYAPPVEAILPEAEVRFPQVAPAIPAPVVANEHVRNANAAARSEPSKVASAASTTPAVSRPARAPAQGRTPPSTEGSGKISLLERMNKPPGESAGRITTARNTGARPARGRDTAKASRGRRGGAVPSRSDVLQTGGPVSLADRLSAPGQGRA